MNHSSINRRSWILQSSMALAGIGLGSRLEAAPGASFLNAFNNEGAIRLNANENPYGPSPMARKAMADAINLTNRYPWQQTTALREMIAAENQLTKDHVLMGAGSSEILGLAAAMVSQKKGNAIVADPTFAIWMNALAAYGTTIIKVPVNQYKSHDLTAMNNRIDNNTSLVYICNPNNPTGSLIPYHLVRDFIESIPQHVTLLLDEAYIEYCDEKSLAHLVSNYQNLIVAKTFSKIYGLAGARIGYALAHPDTIKRLAAFQPWANAGPGAVSIAGALAGMQDSAFIKSTRANNEAVKAFTCNALKAAKIPFIPSFTSFIYYSTERFSGDWQKMLADNQIIAGNIVEQQGKWARITIGTKEEMQRFIQVVQQSFT